MKLLILALGSLLAVEARASHPHHYVVFELDERGSLTPRFQTVVELAADRPSRTDEEIRELAATTSRDVEVLRVRAEDDAGREVFRDAVEVGRSIYTEFASTGEVRPYRVEGRRAFVVRIPAGKATRLSIGSSDLSRGALDSETTFPLDSLQRQVRPLTNVPVPLAVSAPLAGSPANRVDILVMGDGYTAAQQSKFNTDAANLLATFLSVSPYSEYQGFVNSQTAFFASTQSGADHPPYNASCPNPPACCSDTDAISDPLSGTFVNTAFDGTFCTSNVHRLLTVNTTKVFAAAAATPNWDKIFVIVNDSTYGGAGGSIATSSTNSFAVQVAQHEYGHSFSLLADEYSDPYPGFPACSDLTAPACEANVTNQTTRALIKWSPFILGSTPIPTPTGQTTVGLYQGARYLTSGMYRPKDFCAMRALGFDFCEVCKQAYVKRLYSGGWGTPAAGIRNIEPGSESPTPGTVPLTLPGSKTFSVQLLSPTTPALSVTWLVNSVPQAAGITTTSTATSFTYTPPSAGSYAVELRVKDATPLVAATLVEAGQSSTRSWTLSATGGSCCRAGDASGDNNVDINDVVILAAEIVGNVQAGVAPFVAPLQTMNMNPGAGATVDLFDVVILMSFIVGNTPSIPI